MSGVFLLRLIPARAGNTVLGYIGDGKTSAHPRSRGEHHEEIENGRAYGGSSPLARGTPLADAVIFNRRRLIPARAGNTTHPLEPSS